MTGRVAKVAEFCRSWLVPGAGEFHPGAVHPPDFALTHRLSDWPDCRLEIVCGCSSRCVVVPVRGLLQRGDRRFEAVLAGLRCRACGGRPASVFLVAGLTRELERGPPPSWAVALRCSSD